MGDPNASIPSPEPVISRPMFGSNTGASVAVAFVSKASIDAGIGAEFGLQKRLEAVRGCRGLTKRHMRLNDATPQLTVDPETYKVAIDGVVLECAPAEQLPLTQLYQLF